MMTENETKLDALFLESPELDINVHEYNINVTSNEGEEMTREEVLTYFADFEGAGEPTHLYFHLPLCDYICHFCNYVKTRVSHNNRESELDKWAENLVAESSYYLRTFPWVSQAAITSFYIGGGTGALLLNNRNAAERLVRFVQSHYDFSQCVERSIEGNPENFTYETVAFAKELGFNRFSVGVQSLQDEVNNFANRGHSVAEAFRAIETLLSAECPFSVDMMFGLPHQTVRSATADIERLVSLGVPAITIYRLRNSERERMGIGNASVWNKPEIRTKLTDLHAFPSVKETYAMRDSITQVLLENGYHPSPCGWWNKAGLYPDGNIPRVSKDKWQHYHTMLAHGPGAYGWLSGARKTVVQTHNTTKIGEYDKIMAESGPSSAIFFGRRLHNYRAIGTRLGFAYKANQPIPLEFFRRVHGVDLLRDQPISNVIQELLDKKFLEYHESDDSLKPTLKGEMVHEEIMFKYFHQMIGGSLPSACNRAVAEIPPKQLADV